jgi:signal transduction histidine kinase
VSSSRIRPSRRDAGKPTVRRREASAARPTRSDEAARRYRLLLVQSQRMQQQLRRLTQKILTAQEDERRKISRELHDDVVQLLAGVSVQLAALTLDRTLDLRGLRQKITRTRRLVERSIEAVHRFARELRPAMLDDLGLVAALRSFVKTLRAARRLHVRITAYPGIEKVDKERRTILFRVSQEALTNIARHAHATAAQISIRRTPRVIALVIKDDGVSFDVDRVLASRSRKGLGLLGMRERVEMVGGQLAITSAPGSGTVVRALIPLPAATTTSCP